MNINYLCRNKRSICFSSSGSILIYVLWILVVISVLAFQLASASKVITVSQSAFANQLKKQMQIDSAVQFAMFKIISKHWKDKLFELNLNNQEIKISIFNESGFVPIYEVGSETLKRIFEFISLDQATVEELEQAISQENKPQRFNSFSELRQFSGIDGEVLKQLIPLVSIYHEDPVNPAYSPVEVLMQFHRVDQFRVQKLMEATDQTEMAQLRNEIIESLFAREMVSSEDLSVYYRVHILLDGFLHRVFLKYNRLQKKYKVVLIDSSEKNSDGNAS